MSATKKTQNWSPSSRLSKVCRQIVQDMEKYYARTGFIPTRQMIEKFGLKRGFTVPSAQQSKTVKSLRKAFIRRNQQSFPEGWDHSSAKHKWGETKTFDPSGKTPWSRMQMIVKDLMDNSPASKWSNERLRKGLLEYKGGIKGIPKQGNPSDLRGYSVKELIGSDDSSEKIRFFKMLRASIGGKFAVGSWAMDRVDDSLNTKSKGKRKKS